MAVNRDLPGHRTSYKDRWSRIYCNYLVIVLNVNLKRWTFNVSWWWSFDEGPTIYDNVEPPSNVSNSRTWPKTDVYIKHARTHKILKWPSSLNLAQGVTGIGCEVDFGCRLGWEIDFWRFRGSEIYISWELFFSVLFSICLTNVHLFSIIFGMIWN